MICICASVSTSLHDIYIFQIKSLPTPEQQLDKADVDLRIKLDFFPHASVE